MIPTGDLELITVGVDDIADIREASDWGQLRFRERPLLQQALQFLFTDCEKQFKVFAIAESLLDCGFGGTQGNFGQVEFESAGGHAADAGGIQKQSVTDIDHSFGTMLLCEPEAFLAAWCEGQVMSSGEGVAAGSGHAEPVAGFCALSADDLIIGNFSDDGQAGDIIVWGGSIVSANHSDAIFASRLDNAVVKGVQPLILTAFFESGSEQAEEWFSAHGGDIADVSCEQFTSGQFGGCGFSSFADIMPVADDLINGQQHQGMVMPADGGTIVAWRNHDGLRAGWQFLEKVVEKEVFSHGLWVVFGRRFREPDNYCFERRDAERGGKNRGVFHFRRYHCFVNRHRSPNADSWGRVHYPDKNRVQVVAVFLLAGG